MLGLDLLGGLHRWVPAPGLVLGYLREQEYDHPHASERVHGTHAPGEREHLPQCQHARVHTFLELKGVVCVC